MPLDVPVVVQMVNRLGVDNSGQFGTKFKYSMAWDNKPFDHDASMNEEKVLQKVMPGQFIQGTKKPNPHGKGFMIYWDALTDQELARAGITEKPSYSLEQETQHPVLSKNPEPPNTDEKWAKKDIAQTLGMLTKLFFDAQPNELDMYKRFTKSLELAKQYRRGFASAINDCYTEDVIGPVKKDFAPETPPLHTPSVGIDEVNAAFGQ